MTFDELRRQPVYVTHCRTAAVAWRLIRSGCAPGGISGFSTLRLRPAFRNAASLRLRALVAAEVRRERRASR